MPGYDGPSAHHIPLYYSILLDYTRAGPKAQPESMGLWPSLIGATFMISLRNCCYAAIRYEIMKVAPLFGAGPRAHLTARGGKSGVWASGAMEKQFRESGQWPIGLIIWAFCWKRGN